MKPIVLITRTRPDAETLAEKLDRMGYEPLIEPVLTVRSTHAPSPHDPICTEGLIVTSAQAFRHLNSSVMRSILRDKTVYAVGPRTASMARKHGWTNVHDGGGDVHRLGSFLKSRGEITPSSRLMHICGRDIARDTASVMDGVPGKIWTWVVYEADPITRFSPAAEAAIRTGRVRAVLLHSPRGAATMRHCVQAYGDDRAFEGIIYLCLSEAVVESLASTPNGGAYAAPTPDEDALLSLLQVHVPA